jgi:hypothetical protein
MKKYLHYLKNLKICLFIISILCCCIQQSFSQNIRLKIERLGLRIYEANSGPSCDKIWDIDEDCPDLGYGEHMLAVPDPVVQNKLTISGIDYLLDEFKGFAFMWEQYPGYYTADVCVTGWTDHGWHFKNYVDEFSGGYSVKNPMGSPISLYELWYQNNNFNTSTDIDVKMGAYEDDGVLCTGDDAFCGGWNIIHTISDIPNTVAPCGEEFKKSIFCTSDGDGRWWGTHFKVSWQWVSLFEDGIDDVKDVCIGADHVNVYTQIYGTLQNVGYQWQKSTDANNWTDVPGNDVYASVDLSAYNTPMNVYVRKVKKGIACNGFTTPTDEPSNVCIIRIRANPTIAPTATRAPAATNTCEATLNNPTGVQYDGLISYTMEYQTSYDGGVNWSATQNTIPTLINNTTTTINDARIRIRANYTTLSGCSDSPWREYSWNLYAQTKAPTAAAIYPITDGYVCSSDSMVIIFNAGYGGGPSAVDDLDYTTDGGTTWLTYTSGQKIPTPGGAGISYGIRARRIATLTSNCSNTPFTYFGYWIPYRAASSPTLGTKTPNVAGFCKGAYANVSATILSGSFGVPGQAANQYQYSIDAGNTWLNYTAGANISTTNAVDSIYIRVRRVDGNPITNAVGPCSSDWNIIASWRIIDPICDFTATSSNCYNPNAPYIEIRAVRPSPGVGTWSIVSGSGSLSSTSAQNTQLTGTTVGAPTRIRWSVTESGCTETKDTILTPATVSNVNLTNGNICQTCPIRNGNTLRFYDNTGKLMVKIEDVTPPTSELSFTEVCVGTDASVQSVTTNFGAQQPYLQRHFSIDPTTNTTSNVTLYFTAAEFNNLKSACTATQYAFTNVNQLIVSKFPNGGNNVYTLPNANGATYIIPSASGLDVNGYYYLTFPVGTFSTFYIHSTNGIPTVLPIELTYFTSTCENNKIRIEWQTASENNNHHYEIERSENATNYETILSIPSQKGNTNQLQNYIVYDNEPNDIMLYYRLKQVDSDGSFSYSNIININCHNSIEKNTIVSVYPNPTEEILNIAINTTENGRALINVYDMYSSLVKQKEITITKGNHNFDIAINDLPVGIYVVEIINNDSMVFKNKIIKQ